MVVNLLRKILELAHKRIAWLLPMLGELHIKHIDTLDKNKNEEEVEDTH
jgi:hypothetical protein